MRASEAPRYAASLPEGNTAETAPCNSPRNGALVQSSRCAGACSPVEASAWWPLLLQNSALGCCNSLQLPSCASC
eukprot:3211684-Lingulodinium_polyedra.AAC.1